MKSYIAFAFKSLRYRKLRSWLTIIGIIVSVASIVALITLTQGLEDSIKEQFDKIGARKIYVMPKGWASRSIQGLTTRDKEVIEVPWLEIEKRCK